MALVTTKHTIKISAQPKRPFRAFIPPSGSPDFGCIAWRYSSHLTCSWSLSATRCLCHIQTRLQLNEEGSRCRHGWPPGQLGVGSSACRQRLRAESEPFHTCPGVKSKPPPCRGEVGCSASGLGCLARWTRLVHFVCRLANLCLLIGVTYKVTRRSRPGQRWNEPIFWASRKAAQKWTRSDHRTCRSFSDLPSRPCLRGEGRSNLWLGDAFSKTRASSWMQHSTEMAQKGNSCSSHQQRASHLWQCLKWKHEKGGDKSGGTLKGISPIYFAVICFSGKELTAEFYISPGKAASFFCLKRTK